MNIFAQFLPDFMQFSTLETANLILLLGLIMFLGALGGRIFQKLRIPQVVGYIVIGVFIGQSGFQLLSASVITALDPLSNVALSLIGFLIGAELKLSVIKKYGKQFIGRDAVSQNSQNDPFHRTQTWSCPQPLPAPAVPE